MLWNNGKGIMAIWASVKEETLSGRALPRYRHPGLDPGSRAGGADLGMWLWLL